MRKAESQRIHDGRRYYAGTTLRRRRGGPAASDTLARAARRRRASCVTSSSVVPCSRLRRNMRSIDFDAGRVVEIAGRLVGHQQLRLAREARARSRRAAARRRRAASDSASCVSRVRRAPSHSCARRAPRRPRRRARAAASRSRARSARAAAGTTGTRSRAAAGAAPRAHPRRARRARRRRARRRRCVGRSSPASRPSSVVLPDPDAPTMATASPGIDGEADVVEDRQRRLAARHDLRELRGAERGPGHCRTEVGVAGPDVQGGGTHASPRRGEERRPPPRVESLDSTVPLASPRQDSTIAARFHAMSNT